MGFRTAIVLSLAFLAVDGARLAQLGGPRHGVDTQRFITGSDHFTAGTSYQAKEGTYRGYIWLLTLSRRVFGQPEGILVLQWVCGLLSSLLICRLILERTNWTCAVIGTAFFITFPDISQWNNYVLTDSLYISAVAATLFATHRVLRAPSVTRFAALAAALLFGGLLRPSGWLVIAATVPFLWFELQGISRRSVLIALVVVAGGITVFVGTSTFRRSFYGEHPDGGLAAGFVIDGYRAADHRMPSPSFTMDGTLISVARYVWEAPGATAGLVGARLVRGVAHVRPYYSWPHNLIIAVMLWPLNLLALAALPAIARDGFSRYLWLMCASHLLLIAVVLIDWDGRFYIHTLPAVLVLAMDGLHRLIDKSSGSPYNHARTEAVI